MSLAPEPDLIEQMPRLFAADLAGALGEKGKHPRVVCDLPVTLYPLHSDGTIDDPVLGRCRDVSAGGVAFVGPGNFRDPP